MKRLILSLACIAVGFGVAYFEEIAFARNWTNLRAPFDVSLWLDVNGISDASLAWDLIRYRLPCWGMAFVAGVSTAGMAWRSKLIPGVCFCIGMVTTSIFPSFSNSVLWWEGFGFDLLLATVMWELVAIPAYFLGTSLRIPRSLPRVTIRQLMLLTLLVALQLTICLNFQLCGWPGVILVTTSLLAYVARQSASDARTARQVTEPLGS